ncbi:hypothetical protein SUGI_0984660 [Cryptomeria japonica]|nr:hypothetical protein SUGI_0984660 [Cryptomeria japonica]
MEETWEIIHCIMTVRGAFRREGIEFINENGGCISDKATVTIGEKGLDEKPSATLTQGKMKEDDARCTSQESSQFSFEEELARENSPHARTTIMIRNIPNLYSQDKLLEILDWHCKICNEERTSAEEPISAYDFFYLPIDFKKELNLGYAFVNFTSAKATWKLYTKFHMKHCKSLDSKRTSQKIFEITYAKIQGRAALESHFQKINFRCDYEKYLPLVFEPPRNGKEATKYLDLGALLPRGIRTGDLHFFPTLRALTSSVKVPRSFADSLLVGPLGPLSYPCDIPDYSSPYSRSVIGSPPLSPC